MTKKEALSIVFSCAPLYKENLVDRSLLFITTDKHKNVHCLEVTFDIGNFLHMTGFKLRKPGINARHFFNLCYDKRLTEADFEFSTDGTTEMKMRVLPSLMKKNLSAKMLGDYNMSQPKLYTDKIAGSLSACMGFVRDGGEGRFVPNTVLEGDIRTKVKAADRIIATYRKSRSEEQYSEIVFTDSWSCRYPLRVLYIIDVTLQGKIFAYYSKWPPTALASTAGGHSFFISFLQTEPVRSNLHHWKQ